ncbi:uncharacterized protein K452DRAFT_309839 [Aplosporella prunicola CBS 121167]|uniref:RNase H type-1 domain-containing protein n=1 Tax=Aplosporella prunicola CBS 121167 TaxID=1176127 RepID=A0A6A6BE16_9PEZI|nr:uncharacterized protein K452DRAFT_309839 [Aplosporella prunicola CBS 121167]KAF2140731.1 hypothetical protein K452DRAFT_309839 [Aplosporella prunicola CBS 121167]
MTPNFQNQLSSAGSAGPHALDPALDPAPTPAPTSAPAPAPAPPSYAFPVPPPLRQPQSSVPQRREDGDICGPLVWLHHDHARAIGIAVQEEFERRKELDRLVMWTDAGCPVDKLQRPSGFSITWQENRNHDIPWTDKSAVLFPKSHEQINASYAETMAILHALKIAYAAKGCGRNTVATVAVYTDSQPALQNIHRGLTGLSLVDVQSFASMEDRSSERIIREVLSCIYDLTVLGVRVELRWVPRDQVLGNKRADRLVQAARRVGDLLMYGSDYRHRPKEGWDADVGWRWVPVWLVEGDEDLRGQIRFYRE